MPTISISKAYFNTLVGRNFTLQEFEELCFDFGLEAEEDTDKPGNIRVELPANRYDLFCVEGLALTIANYLSSSDIQPHVHHKREYKICPPTTYITVDKSVKSVRPFVVCGIIRNMHFNKDMYESFIDFQDKLHHNLGRKRTLVSIGTHDLDKVKGPFKYVAKARNDFAFTPLGKTEALSGGNLLKLYETDFHLKNYLHIIEKSELVPLILDSEDRILSMPPIINSEFSKIDLNTKNLFVEITATDKTKALMALNVLMSSFSQFSEQKFTFEQVEVRDVGETFVTPVSPLNKSFFCKKDYLETVVGVKFSTEQIISYLAKMGLEATLEENKEGLFKVEIPFYRTDVMHPCDIAEDLAIAYGYNNVPHLETGVVCAGLQVPLNKLTELARAEMAAAGFSECLNFALCSVDDLTTRLLKKTDNKMVEIANPKSLDFQVGRTSLLTGMIKAIVANKSNELPLKLFEIGDVVLVDSVKLTGEVSINPNVSEYYSASETVGAINQRRICLVYSNNTTSGLDLLHGSMDLLFKKLFDGKVEYELRENEAPFLYAKLQAGVFVKGEKVGEMGVVHPEILKQYKWPYPISMLELDFERLADFYLIKGN